MPFWFEIIREQAVGLPRQPVLVQECHSSSSSALSVFLLFIIDCALIFVVPLNFFICILFVLIFVLNWLFFFICFRFFFCVIFIRLFICILFLSGPFSSFESGFLTSLTILSFPRSSLFFAESSFELVFLAPLSTRWEGADSLPTMSTAVT